MFLPFEILYGINCIVILSNSVNTHHQSSVTLLSAQVWYFFRIFVIFNLIWLPGMFISVYGNVHFAEYQNLIFIGRLFCGIQPIISFCFSMMKTEVRNYTINLLTLSYIRRALEDSTKETAIAVSGTNSTNSTLTTNGAESSSAFIFTNNKVTAISKGGDEDSAFMNQNEVMPDDDDIEDPSPPLAMPDEENPSPLQHGVSMFKLKEDKEEQEQQCNTVVAPVSVSVREEEKGEEKSPRNNGDMSIVQVVLSPKKEPTNQLKLKEDESNNNETSVLVLASASARILVVSASAMNIKDMRGECVNLYKIKQTYVMT